MDVYESFIKGANSISDRNLPTMLALMIAVGILRASGLLEAIGMWIGSMTDHGRFPWGTPLTVVKMFSSSATGLLLDLYKEYGTDSELDLCIHQYGVYGDDILYDERVFYDKSKKSRYTLPGALIATFAGIAASVVLEDVLRNEEEKIAS